MLKDVFKAGMLFDFYSVMLSDRQNQATSLYYFENLSLGEVGEVLGITRQGAYDLIKTAEKIVLNYEEKFGLVEKYMKQRGLLMELKSDIQNSDIENKYNLIKKIDELDRIIND